MIPLWLMIDKRRSPAYLHHNPHSAASDDELVRQTIFVDGDISLPALKQ